MDNIYTLYKNKLIDEGILTKEEADARWNKFMKHYNNETKLADDEKLA